MTEDINGRFLEVVGMLARTPAEFSQETGLLPQTLSAIKKRKYIVSTDVLLKTKEKFPRVNLNWIFIGEGEPLSVSTRVEELMKQLNHVKEKINLLENLVEEKSRTIRLMELTCRDHS